MTADVFIKAFSTIVSLFMDTNKRNASELSVFVFLLKKLVHFDLLLTNCIGTGDMLMDSFVIYLLT